MKMSQSMEKYMEQVNKLVALSDRIKLVPLNKLAKVVEVIESNRSNWPDENFKNNLQKYLYSINPTEAVAMHNNTDLMLFTQGACRGYLLDDVYSWFDWEFTDCIEETFKKTDTDNFKLVLLKFPKSFIENIVLEDDCNQQIRQINRGYLKILEELFKPFKECEDTDEIPLDIPILSIPVDDISLCERIYGDATLVHIEKFYEVYASKELERIHKVFAMKTGPERGAKLINFIKTFGLQPVVKEELDNELIASQDIVHSKLRMALGLPIRKDCCRKEPEDITICSTCDETIEKIKIVPEELKLLFALQSIFQILGIQDGFERIVDMNRNDATEYIQSIMPVSPDEVINILIEKCKLDLIEYWPTPELIKLFPLYRAPAKANADDLVFYRYLNLLSMESVFAYSPALENKFLASNFFLGVESVLAGCVRLSVNSIPCLFEVFENPKNIIPRKLYIPTEDNEIKYMAALISAFCDVEIYCTEPQSIPSEKIFQLSYYYQSDNDRMKLSENLSNDIDKMDQCSTPGLLVIPRSFTHDDFFAPLRKKIVKTRRIEQIIDYNDRLTIILSDKKQGNVKFFCDEGELLGNKTIPYSEIAKFFCLEPAHYPTVIITNMGDIELVKNIKDYINLQLKNEKIVKFSQFNSLQPFVYSHLMIPIESNPEDKQVGELVEIIDGGDVPLMDTLLIQSSTSNSLEHRFVVAATTMVSDYTMCLRCQQLLPDYLAIVLEKYKAMIFWGTAPGQVGDAERMRRIKQIAIPKLSLKEQFREVFFKGSELAAIEEEVEMRLKFDEAARRFLSEKISAETIDLMANGIISIDKYSEYVFIYNISQKKLDSFKETILIEMKHYFEIMLPSMRWNSLKKIKTALEQDKSEKMRWSSFNQISTLKQDKSEYPLLEAFISKLSKYVDNEIARILKDAGISEPAEDLEIRRALANLDAEIMFEERRQREEEKSKAEERKKVIADMSHHIKNLVMSVIDPLELLREDDPKHQVVIDNAIRGAELIREIINAMNLSFSGSTEGVIYDFNHPSHGSLQLRDILISGLKNAVSNMFDGKYFSQFRHEYFPSKDKFVEAKQQWQKLDIARIDELKALMEQYFFKLDLKLLNADIPVGNQNSSATKLLIMFQEIMLNAVKYTSFVPPLEREILVMLAVDGSQITLEVENTFNPKSAVKSSGLGHIIIKNFATLLGAKVDTDINKGRYKVRIAFDFNPEGAKPNTSL